MNADTQAQSPAEKKPIEPVKPKPPKVKITPILVADIVDVLKLFRASIEENPWPYPSLTSEHAHDLMGKIYNYLAQPSFLGFVMRVGRRPIGQILAHIEHRPLGYPSNYVFIFNFYIDPSFRRKGLMTQLSNEFFQQCKKIGAAHWEANVLDQELERLLTSYPHRQVVQRYVRLGGKI